CWWNLIQRPDAVEIGKLDRDDGIGPATRAVGTKHPDGRRRFTAGGGQGQDHISRLQRAATPAGSEIGDFYGLAHGEERTWFLDAATDRAFRLAGDVEI